MNRYQRPEIIFSGCAIIQDLHRMRFQPKTQVLDFLELILRPFSLERKA
jgi:hypothetical protein